MPLLTANDVQRVIARPWVSSVKASKRLSKQAFIEVVAKMAK